MYLRKREKTYIIYMQPLYCYHCCHKIEGKTLGLPYERCQDGKYKCSGNFCSFPCMKTYSLELNDSYKNERFTLIGQMFYESTGTWKCQFAPRREQLKIFGGTLNIENFRKQSNSTPVPKLMPPMEPVTIIFDKHENFSLNKKQEDDIVKNTPATNEPIKLQRAKPLKNSQNTLEVTMGLFRD